MSTTPEPSATTPKRVAVIAVHGVADQQPGETTTAIANLLGNIDDGDRPAYAPFESESVRIPVRAIEFEDRETHKHQDWATRARYCREGRVKAAAPTGGGVDAGLEFMSSLLAGYEPSGPEETYETERLRSRRFGGRSGEVRQVDVYEMYWADLSRLKQTWLRVFAEFYQLLFHLGSLGAHAVRAAQASEREVDTPELWKTWAERQRAAADVLARPVLLMNLFLPGLLLVLFAALPSEAFAANLVWIAYGLLALGFIGVLSYRRYKRAASVRGLALTGLGAAFASLVVLKYLDWPDGTAHRVLATVVAGVVAAAIAAIAFSYNRRRPGAAKTAAALGSALGALFLAELWILPQGSEPQVQAAALHSAEYVYIALRLAFVLFLWRAWRAAWAGSRVVRASNGPATDRVKRLNWTARFTLSLPVFLFLLGTTVLWVLIWMAVSPLLGEVLTTRHQLRWVTPIFMPELAQTQTVNDVVTGLINNGSGHGFGPLMFAALVASVLAAYAIAPSVFFELQAPDSPRDGTASGRWLDAGFHLMRWGGRVLVFGVLVVLPLGGLAGIILNVVYPPWFEGLAGFNTRLLVRTGAILAPAGAGLILFNRLKQITLGFRNVVDVLLDVDNYLREYPRESNPRARIATRMASLLRYVYAQNYSSLVIIAHSQGTVITADLLRFIHLTNTGQKDAGLARRNGIPISFFTMGSPLRQLYGLRFPHLYQWARHQLLDPWTDEREMIAAETGPDPAELDLAVWVNAYRSADYIGRYLWRPEVCDFAFKTPPMKNDHPWQAGTFDAIASHSPAPPDNRREFCIGAGAHQHYWDGTAPQVALQLDALIRR